MNQIYTPSNKSRAYLALALIAIILILEIISLYFEFQQHDLITKISLGYEYSNETIENNDNRLNFMASVLKLANLISIITFISWFYRAYNNLNSHLGSVNYNISWSIWGWFLPIMNLFRPFNIMSELYRKTTEYLQKNLQTPIISSWKLILGLWWTFWLLRMFAGQILKRMELASITIDQILEYSYMGLLRSFIAIPATIITLKVIYDYSKLEIQLDSIDITKNEEDTNSRNDEQIESSNG